MEHGATTIWENWNAALPDGTKLPVSYNHYAFGCVGEWMYRYLGGIYAKQSGYKKIRIEPHIDCGLSFVSVEHESVYGMIRSAWKLESDQFQLDVELPENTITEIVLPGAAGKMVKESGKSIENMYAIRIDEKSGNIVCEVGSGSYHFCY